MAELAVTNTFVDATVIEAAPFNTNFADIVTFVNNRNDGTTTWDALRVTTSSAIVAILDNSSGVSDILRCRDNGTVCFAVSDGGATAITATGAATVPLTVTNGTSTGNILAIKDNTSAIMTIADGGALTYDGAAVFNEAGADVDFRIEGDTVTGLFLVDASADMVSIDSLHVGGTSDPGADNLLVDGTLEVTGATTLTGLTKTVAGVHVGGTSDPGADNLLVDGTAEVTGLTKTTGGVHVGGSSDPGADNLLVDGTAEITGLTKTTGGVHVGGSSDPGADNLLVDGTCNSVGSLIVGSAAVATDATGPFMYVTTCAGTPTGTPTSQTGRSPVVWDSTNDKWYIYDGGWVMVNKGVDDSTIEVNSNALRVKDAGITEAKLAAAVVSQLGQNIGLIARVTSETASATYQDVVNYTGQGRLLGISYLEEDNGSTPDTAHIKITIDGVDHGELAIANAESGHIILGPGNSTTMFATETSGVGNLNELYINFNTSLLIQHKVDAGGATADTINTYVAYEHE